jgi:hypothetical protein
VIGQFEPRSHQCRRRATALISSSYCLGYERGLHTGASNEDTAELRVMHHTVVYDAAHASALTIPVDDGVSPP